MGSSLRTPHQWGEAIQKSKPLDRHALWARDDKQTDSTTVFRIIKQITINKSQISCFSKCVLYLGI